MATQAGSAQGSPPASQTFLPRLAAAAQALEFVLVVGRLGEVRFFLWVRLEIVQFLITGLSVQVYVVLPALRTDPLRAWDRNALALPQELVEPLAAPWRRRAIQQRHHALAIR